MASELSRLIDDELEKFERRPSAEEQTTQKAAFGIKAGAQKSSAQPTYRWRSRGWWTWKRIGYALLILIAIIASLIAISGSGSSSSSTAVAGTNSGSRSSNLSGTGALDSQGEEVPKPITPPVPQHTHKTTPAVQAVAPLAVEAEAPASLPPQLSTGVAGLPPADAASPMVASLGPDAQPRVPAASVPAAFNQGESLNASSVTSPAALDDVKGVVNGSSSAVQGPVSVVHVGPLDPKGRKMLRRNS